MNCLGWKRTKADIKQCDILILEKLPSATFHHIFFSVPMHLRATDELNFVVKMSVSKHKFKLACLIW